MPLCRAEGWMSMYVSIQQEDLSESGRLSVRTNLIEEAFVPNMHFFSISSVVLLLMSVIYASTQQENSPEITSQLTKFSLSFFQSVAAKLGPSENLLVSPLNLASALSLVLAGAKEKTAFQLKNTLKLTNFTDEQIYATVGNLVRSVKDNGDFILEAANRMYVDKSYQLASPFQEILTNKFGAPGQRVDFQTYSEESRVVINEWIEKFTRSKIKNLLPEVSVNSLTKLVLVNALYFKGDWVTKFNPKWTFEKPFYLESRNNQIYVPMMQSYGKYRVGNFDQLDARVLRIPYKGNKLSMLIVLPNKIDGLLDVEAKLLGISGALDTIEQMLVEEELEIALPKFKIEAAVPDVKNSLIQLGIKDLFDEGHADLSGIPDNGRKGLFVTDVFQKCFIEVNEEGSEAAAATASPESFESLSQVRKGFLVNHPALFFIRVDDLKLILFSGRLANPSSSSA